MPNIIWEVWKTEEDREKEKVRRREREREREGRRRRRWRWSSSSQNQSTVPNWGRECRDRRRWKVRMRKKHFSFSGTVWIYRPKSDISLRYSRNDLVSRYIFRNETALFLYRHRYRYDKFQSYRPIRVSVKKKKYTCFSKKEKKRWDGGGLGYLSTASLLVYKQAKPQSSNTHSALCFLSLFPSRRLACVAPFLSDPLFTKQITSKLSLSWFDFL